MSQRKQRRDEVWPKRSIDTSNTADVQGVGGDRLNSGRGWRRRSLFSSERLDLILSNLRRNLGKSVDDDRCKPISHDLTDGSGDQRTHLRRLQKQQQQRGAGKHRRISDTIHRTKDRRLHSTNYITREGRIASDLCRQLSLHDTTCS